MTSLLDINEVSNILGLTSPLDKHDIMVRGVWEYILETDYRYCSYSSEMTLKINETKELIMAMPISPILEMIHKKMLKRNLTDILSSSAIYQLLHGPNAKQNGDLDWLAKLIQTLLG
jgi:hypothetical protein